MNTREGDLKCLKVGKDFSSGPREGDLKFIRVGEDFSSGSPEL